MSSLLHAAVSFGTEASYSDTEDKVLPESYFPSFQLVALSGLSTAHGWVVVGIR